jgi:hemerythrin-like metal-binding protein
MMELVWTNELSVGNANIDEEHRNLISMINNVKHEIKTRNSSALPQTFKQLENWLYAHFTNEEKIAQAINFPFHQHKLAQQHSLRELQHLRDELVAKDGIWSDGAAHHFIRSLKKWMIDEHIINLDMRMKTALQNYAYNFLPDCGHGESGYAAVGRQIP